MGEWKGNTEGDREKREITLRMFEKATGTYADKLTLKYINTNINRERE